MYGHVELRGGCCYEELVWFPSAPLLVRYRLLAEPRSAASTERSETNTMRFTFVLSALFVGFLGEYLDTPLAAPLCSAAGFILRAATDGKVQSTASQLKSRRAAAGRAAFQPLSGTFLDRHLSTRIPIYAANVQKHVFYYECFEVIFLQCRSNVFIQSLWIRVCVTKHIFLKA